jgi:hypothetical protein
MRHAERMSAKTLGIVHKRRPDVEENTNRRRRNGCGGDIGVGQVLRMS